MTPTPAQKNEKKIFGEKGGEKNYGLEFEKERRAGVGNMGEQRTGIALSESAKV